MFLNTNLSICFAHYFALSDILEERLHYIYMYIYIYWKDLYLDISRPLGIAFMGINLKPHTQHIYAFVCVCIVKQVI